MVLLAPPNTALILISNTVPVVECQLGVSHLKHRSLLTGRGTYKLHTGHQVVIERDSVLQLVADLQPEVRIYCARLCLSSGTNLPVVRWNRHVIQRAHMLRNGQDGVQH